MITVKLLVNHTTFNGQHIEFGVMPRKGETVILDTSYYEVTEVRHDCYNPVPIIALHLI